MAKKAKPFIEVCESSTKVGRNRPGWWRVKSPAQILLHSENYTRYRKAREAARRFAKQTGLRVKEIFHHAQPKRQRSLRAR